MASSTPHAPGRFFGSPRAQRRILIGSSLVFVAGVIAFVSIVLLRGTGNAFVGTISNKPATLIKKDKKVPPSPAAFKVARKFLETAVLRKNVDASYNLVHVDLKGRMTRKQWDTGNIPVVDYPANNAKTAAFQVDFSYQTEMLLEVNLVAKRGSPSTVRPNLDFFLGLKRAGGKKDGRWLVNYWEPHWRPPVPLAGAG
ncbi:MAG TPA: hypothetical protein VFA97_00095 [Gaiellaceae bacterium]|nr:hypothetical protein [Gaiellaceae bacterium]